MLVGPAAEPSTDPPLEADPAPSGVKMVDLIVRYARGNSTNIKANINTRIYESNQALKRSKANVRLNVLEIRSAPYTQSTSSQQIDLSALQGGTSGLGIATTRRDQLGADLVTLVVPTATDSCGLAWIAGSGADYGFSVTAASCMSNFTLTHEIGHNLGANHNPEATSSNLPYAYSHGKIVPGKVRSVMSYPCPVACPRVLQFSNPDVNFLSELFIPSGDTTQRDNARSIDNFAFRVSNYKARLIASDVPESHPYYSEIMWVIGNGISTGYADGTFRPQEDVNRKSMAAFLYRLAGSPSYTPPSSSPFLDVSTSSQFYKEISWLAAQGISNGYTVQGGKEFRPLESVKREAMAAFLYRFAGSPSYNPPSNSPFTDLTTSSSFYKQITWLNAAEITTGYSDGTFRPDAPVARYAMAAFLYRFDHMVD